MEPHYRPPPASLNNTVKQERVSNGDGAGWEVLWLNSLHMTSG